MSGPRPPAVSGSFYPSLPARLRADVRGYLDAGVQPRRAPAVIAPHAGYMYSGVTAGVAFAAAAIPATCVVLAPNHTGRAIVPEGGSLLVSRQYRTPLGDVPVDDALAAAIVERASPLVGDDAIAHAGEHAVEVIVPFLQVRNPEVRLVPLVLGWTDWDRTRRLAAAIAGAIGARDDVLVVASSDMNHYESAAVSERKDMIALEQVAALDGEGLLRVTREQHITMCGRVPAACACEVVRLRRDKAAGGARGEVIAYSHSGQVTGDHERVVGYAAVLLGV